MSTVRLERNPDKRESSSKFESQYGWKSSDGRWSLVESSNKGKKGKGGRVAKKERDSRNGGGKL
jgi:hypothetical protein